MKENNSLLDYGLRKLLACGLSIWQSSGGPPDRPVWERGHQIENHRLKRTLQTPWKKKKLKKCSETYLSTLVDIFLDGVNCNCYLQQANAKRHIKSGPKKNISWQNTKTEASHVTLLRYNKFWGRMSCDPLMMIMDQIVASTINNVWPGSSNRLLPDFSVGLLSWRLFGVFFSFVIRKVRDTAARKLNQGRKKEKKR